MRYLVGLIGLGCLTLIYWQWSSQPSAAESTTLVSQKIEPSTMAVTLGLSPRSRQEEMIELQLSHELNMVINLDPKQPVLEATPSESVTQPVNDENLTIEEFHSLTDRQRRDITKTAPDTTQNRPPHINQTYYEQLQQQIAGWVLPHGSAIHYSVAIEPLFIDPDGDLLSYRVELNSRALQVRSLTPLTLTGIADSQESELRLSISANDNQHGLESENWVTAHFSLPAIKPQPPLSDMLIDQPLYRINTTRTLGSQRYPFHVLQCELFELKEGNVWYAAANHRRRCPQLEEMRIVATYQQQDEQIHLHFPAGKTASWQLRHHYPSHFYSDLMIYHITSNENGQEMAFSLFDQRVGAESRLNVDTGEYQYQGLNFDYLMLNAQQEFYPIGLFNYIFDVRHIQPNYYQPADSDLNVFHPTHSLFCRDIEPYWAYSSLIGSSHYQIPLISESGDRAGNYPPLCGEYVRTKTRIAVYLDHEFLAQDVPVAGEIYTYLLYPRPEYAHLLERFAINLIYHSPK